MDARATRPKGTDEVLPGLLLGDASWLIGNSHGKPPMEVLREHGITHVLTVAHELRSKQQTGIEHLIVAADDCDEQDLISHFDQCNSFIEEGRTKGRVLVHCLAGVSRSATMVAAYLMKTQRLSSWEALDLLREKRSMARPNSGFFEQLQFYEAMDCQFVESPSNSHHYYQAQQKFCLKAKCQLYSASLQSQSQTNGEQENKKERLT
ncbi:tyrosine protein phosphatase yvh1 [Balamuthia mandrillaris]